MHATPKVSTVPPATPDRLVSVKDVCAITGAGRSWVFKKTAALEFPQPIRIGTRYTRWKLQDVQSWLADPDGWISANKTAKVEGGAA